MKSLLLREIPLQHGAFADRSRASKQYRARSEQRATINEEQDVVIIGAGMLSLNPALLFWVSPPLESSFSDKLEILPVQYYAGVAGLSCGKHLKTKGVKFSILEASDGVGGRVRSDKVDGFTLDRGFQIFLTSYPTAKEMLDYTALDLKPFYAGKTRPL